MFSDISQHWARPCITALAKRDIIRGYPNGTFRPSAVVSRAEFASLMQQVFPQIPVKRSPMEFPDVFAEYWANGAIRWASERGLFSGDEQGRFLPKQTISRVQAVVVLVSGLSAEQASEATSEPEAALAEQSLSQAVARTFNDAQSIPRYALESVGRAIESSLLESLPEPRAMHPDRSMTRGEVAALLCRALNIPAAELTPDLPGLGQTRQNLFQGLFRQESGFGAEKLAFLDRTIQRSSYRKDIKRAALRLQLPEGIPLTPADPGMEGATPNPARGETPTKDACG